MLKKGEYIAKYGEEAWAVEFMKRKDRGRRWREKNPEYNKEWKKNYRKNNAEKCKEADRQYYLRNTEKQKNRSRNYKNKHQKYYTDYRKKYYATKNGRAKFLKFSYNKRDLEKGFTIDQNIDEKWIMEHVFESTCVYCGESEWDKLGVDRIDNSKGHTPDNCVPCCEKCNKTRSDRYSFEEFLKMKRGGD